MMRVALKFFILLTFYFHAESICGKKVIHLNQYANPETDVTEILQKLINEYDEVIIDKGRWYVSYGIKLRSDVIIKGSDKNESIIVRSQSTNHLHYGLMFSTESIIPYEYDKNIEKDIFDEQTLQYHNINFSNLTFDLNRNTEADRYMPFLSAAYSIVLCKAYNCSVSNCTFLDNLTTERKSNHPTVIIYQSRKCKISNCCSNNVAFLQISFSERIKVNNNTCINSIGTAIETISGGSHIIKGNTVRNVIDNVSSIGINSTNCLISNNRVFARNNTISCLTLGHEGHFSGSASGCVVSHNWLYSEGRRAIIIQQGENIKLLRNECTCITNDVLYPKNTGCIVAAAGDESCLGNLFVKSNKLKFVSNVRCGCVAYGGSGLCVVKRNIIDAQIPLSLWSVKADMIAQHNKFISSEQIFAFSNGFIDVSKNHFLHFSESEEPLIETVEGRESKVTLNNNTFRF